MGHFFAGTFHRLRLLDGVRPVPAEFVERVINGAGLDRADAAAAHGAVKHEVALLPGSVALIVGDIVQDGSVAISPFERAAHDRPERLRNGGAIHF